MKRDGAEIAELSKLPLDQARQIQAPHKELATLYGQPLRELDAALAKSGA